jgi:imidazolonepropionase-like amidohydrolase
MTDAGVPALDAIRAATVNAADTFGLRDLVGGIAAGSAANVIGVDGDPMRDPNALGRVQFVMRTGRVVLDARAGRPTR